MEQPKIKNDKNGTTFEDKQSAMDKAFNHEGEEAGQDQDRVNKKDVNYKRDHSEKKTGRNKR
jgi:hypothetical protein